ncbi:MAG TPA: glycerophosphodiester phosphodiesterase [Microbacteriaceae bacterium]|nr:glycerophosphodiester phosphodiesterase [Microbacteriaceae bacterium]
MHKRGVVKVRVGEALGSAYRLTFGRLGGWLALIAVLQGIVVLIAVPGLQALFGAALRTAHVTSLSLDTAARFFATPAGALLFALLIVVGLVALFTQATAFLLAAATQQADADGALPHAGALLRGIRGRLRHLLRPSSLLLVPYAFLLAPLGGAALGTVFTSWIMVPNFVSGELSKTPTGALVYAAALLVLWYLALRLLLTIPFMAIAGLSAPQAMAASWRATGWVPWRLILLLLGVLVPVGVAALVLGGLGLGVTALGDLTEQLGADPDVAVGVGAGVWGALQVLVFFLTGLAVALQSHVFARLVATTGHATADIPAVAVTPRTLRRVLGIGAPIGALVSAVLLALQIYPHLDRLDDAETMIVAHRGAPRVAVENTIPALEAAHAQGADLVEFDTIQTADGDWVVMHDFNLARLAGDPRDTADLTLAELTSMTVTADGFEAPIPSLREFVRRAHELGQDLLIEIKPSGKETDDYLERFFAILDEEGVTESSLYHSLSADVVADQLAMRPWLTVGYIVSVNVGGLPETPAQFVVVEEWSYTADLRNAAWDAGKGILVWTVNEPAAMRTYLREPVDGIISDLPDVAGEERREVVADRSLTAKLWDALDRLIAIG